jgi:hypothetical protein
MKRPAFATTAALMLMVVLAAALLTLSSLLRADGNRTINEAQEAQLRQLIHAAALDARTKSNAGGDVPRSWDVTLPSNIGAVVHVELRDHDATVDAQISNLRRTETVGLP